MPSVLKRLVRGGSPTGWHRAGRRDKKHTLPKAGVFPTRSRGSTEARGRAEGARKWGGK